MTIEHAPPPRQRQIVPTPVLMWKDGNSLSKHESPGSKCVVAWQLFGDLFRCYETAMEAARDDLIRRAMARRRRKYRAYPDFHPRMRFRLLSLLEDNATEIRRQQDAAIAILADALAREDGEG